MRAFTKLLLKVESKSNANPKGKNNVTVLKYNILLSTFLEKLDMYIPQGTGKFILNYINIVWLISSDIP